MLRSSQRCSVAGGLSDPTRGRNIFHGSWAPGACGFAYKGSAKNLFRNRSCGASPPDHVASQNVLVHTTHHSCLSSKHILQNVQLQVMHCSVICNIGTMDFLLRSSIIAWYETLYTHRSILTAWKNASAAFVLPHPPSQMNIHEQPSMHREGHTVVTSVEELDKLLAEGYELPGPEDATRSLEPLFLKASPIHSRLRRLKQLYGAHPATEQRFSLNRVRANAAAAMDPLVNLRGYQRAFEQMAAGCRQAVFAQGRVERFLDLGCSPGGFSNWLLENNKDAHGVGITLADEDARWRMVVEGTHLQEPRYELRFADIVALVLVAIGRAEDPVIAQDGQPGGAAFDLVVAGAFPTLASTRVSIRYRLQLALSQLLVLFCNLRCGGDAVVVTNTKTRSWIVEILALLRQCFLEVRAGKGGKLHTERSSCYLICTGFCATDEEVAEHVAMLKRALLQLDRAKPEQPEDEPSDSDMNDGNDAAADGDGDEGEHEDRKWRGVLQFSERTTQELFDAEHRFVLDLFEPLWHKQYNAIYKSFSKMLTDEAHEQRDAAQPLPGTSGTPSASSLGILPNAHAYGGPRKVPEWRRFAGPPSPASSATQEGASPDVVSTPPSAASLEAAKYVVPARRASTGTQPADGWRARAAAPPVPILSRPRGATIADTNAAWRSRESAREDRML